MTLLMHLLKSRPVASGRHRNGLMIFRYPPGLTLSEVKASLKTQKIFLPVFRNQPRLHIVTGILLTAIGWALVNLPTTWHLITSHAQEITHVYFALSFLDACGSLLSILSGQQPGRPFPHLSQRVSPAPQKRISVSLAYQQHVFSLGEPTLKDLCVLVHG